MKIRSFLEQVLLLGIVFIFFLLPPLIQTSAQPLDFSNTVHLPRIFFQAVCAAAILVAAKKCYGIAFSVTDRTELKTNRTQFLFKIAVDFGAAIGTCGALCICAALLQLAALYFTSGNTAVQVIMPTSVVGWIFCAATLLFSAFYEEALYRVFLPEVTLVLLSECIIQNPRHFYKKQRFCVLTAESISAAIFALSHRYLGVLAVINAAAGYVILRTCLKKTQSIAPGCAAHFIYNILNLLLLNTVGTVT